MKKLKAFLFGSLLIGLCLCFLAGCNSYNAYWDSHANKCISQEFMDNNHVRGAYYRYENYDGYDDGYYDETSPGNRTYIITEEQEFEKIFTKYPGIVDFDKRTVILYIFSDCSPRQYFLKDIYREDGTLIVKYELERYIIPVGDATMPYQRCFMLIMDKTEFNEVKFERFWS